MKNQYFGDINDYRKYGLLRALIQHGEVSMGVGWMLTPDDGRTDGGHTTYLNRPSVWRRHDPDLFDHLKTSLRSGSARSVDMIEGTNLLGDTAFHREHVLASEPPRAEWLRGLLETSVGRDLVFLDPDNGLEVRSVRFGRANSDKYVYWREVRALFERGHSLLIYQHFPRRPREAFTEELGARLAREVGIESVVTLATSNVLFLMAPQIHHQDRLAGVAAEVRRRWGDQFRERTVLA